MSAVTAATLETKLWPASLGYACAYVLAGLGVVEPGLAYGVCHVLLSINTGWVWWPRAGVGDDGGGPV